ncbi:MAG: hypothetical protein IJJ67_05650 [Oscillospiraceae bacterium]|nr:hypothetical protein [Oscillospiraceae bacterium]
MSIRNISITDVRKMEGKEGLVIEGCGGELREWVDGINEELSEAGVLLNGSRFENCASFNRGDVTCLLFPFEDDVQLDMGRFAMWRINNHYRFGGTWLSDYVPNRLGGFIQAVPSEAQKPRCPLIGQDGNIFNLMGIASQTLRQNGMADQAKEMCDRITSSGDYYKALGIIGEYVEITSVDDPDEDEGMNLNM